MVTLRGSKMYEFFDRLVNLAFLGADFKPSAKSFDSNGNTPLALRSK
jgi:ribosomal protein L5